MLDVVFFWVGVGVFLVTLGMLVVLNVLEVSIRRRDGERKPSGLGPRASSAGSIEFQVYRFHGF